MNRRTCLMTSQIFGGLCRVITFAFFLMPTDVTFQTCRYPITVSKGNLQINFTFQFPQFRPFSINSCYEFVVVRSGVVQWAELEQCFSTGFHKDFGGSCYIEYFSSLSNKFTSERLLQPRIGISTIMYTILKY